MSVIKKTTTSMRIVKNDGSKARRAINPIKRKKKLLKKCKKFHKKPIKKALYIASSNQRERGPPPLKFSSQHIFLIKRHIQNC